MTEHTSSPVDRCTYGTPLRTPYPYLAATAPYLYHNVFTDANCCWTSGRGSVGPTLNPGSPYSFEKRCPYSPRAGEARGVRYPMNLSMQFYPPVF